MMLRFLVLFTLAAGLALGVPPGARADGHEERVKHQDDREPDAGLREDTKRDAGLAREMKRNARDGEAGQLRAEEDGKKIRKQRHEKKHWKVGRKHRHEKHQHKKHRR